MWSDIDYMLKYRDFEYNTVDFSGLPKLIDDLHSKNQHYIPIVDAGIALRPDPADNYQAYLDGKKADVYIKAYQGGEDFTGAVWPGDAVFPSFFKESTIKWW